MNCKKFQNQLLNRADNDAPLSSPEAIVHIETCKTCARLYQLDTGLDHKIKSALAQQEVPKALFDQVELTLDHAAAPSRISKFKLTAALTLSFLVFFFAFNLFFNGPFQYQNLQQLNEKVVASHLKGNTHMSFSSSEIDQSVAMLSRELKFNVIFPDLTDKGYVLLGGRLCALGKCKIAYLFYEKQNRISSLVIMSYDHLDFEMAEGSRFSNDVKGYHTDIWKEHGQVYAMVY